MESMREATEWSASTATLPLEQASPRSLAGEEDDDDELTEEDVAWATEGRSRKGLRTLLLEMDVDDEETPSSVPRPKQAAGDSGDEEEGEEDGVAQRMELRLAEERVRTLEARLLDAEETIYHLKAEKMDAWRRVEKLTRSTSVSEDEEAGGDAVMRLRTQVYELEGQLKDQQTQHAVELEEQMAVIREQEREIMELKEQLTEVQGRADEMETKYEQLRTARERELAYEQKEEEEDDDPVKTLSGADTTSALTWHEELIRHPTPHFDLDSPEVQYLLFTWTKNPKKLQYLRTWLTHVALQNQRELPLDFPMGIELPRLAPEVKDGFLTLVVPLLRKQPWREIQVHTKQYNDAFHADLRIRVIPRRP